jgi:hypothetical protein
MYDEFRAFFFSVKGVMSICDIWGNELHVYCSYSGRLSQSKLISFSQWIVHQHYYTRFDRTKQNNLIFSNSSVFARTRCVQCNRIYSNLFPHWRVGQNTNSAVDRPVCLLPKGTRCWGANLIRRETNDKWMEKNILARVWVTYKTSFDWMIGFIDHSLYNHS